MGGLARPGDGAGRTGEKRWSRGTVATSDPVSFNIVNLGNFKATQLFITPIIFEGMAKENILWLSCVLFFRWYIWGHHHLLRGGIALQGSELPLTEAGNIFVSFRHKTSNFPLSFRWKWRRGGERGPERLFLELYWAQEVEN